MSRVRLVKVIVQPVFVIDDGETLQEAVGQPISVGAAQLDEVPAGVREALRSAQEQVDAAEPLPLPEAEAS